MCEKLKIFIENAVLQGMDLVNKIWLMEVYSYP